MKHFDHGDVKRLRIVLESANRETLMSLHAQIGLIKSTATEAMTFLEAQDVLESARSITALYWDLNQLQERIAEIANMEIQT